MSMRTIRPVIPGYLLTLIETLRARLREADFQAHQRVRPADFTRAGTLAFQVLMLFVLQKSGKSIQPHLHEFFDDLAAGPHFQPLTSGAGTGSSAWTIPWCGCQGTRSWDKSLGGKKLPIKTAPQAPASPKHAWPLFIANVVDRLT